MEVFAVLRFLSLVKMPSLVSPTGSLLIHFSFVEDISAIDGLSRLRHVQDASVDQIMSKLGDDAVAALGGENVDSNGQILFMLSDVREVRGLSDCPGRGQPPNNTFCLMERSL